MAQICSHLPAVDDAAPSGDGCVECLASGDWWVHLRRCVICGHVGCCDSSPNRHATAHFHADEEHPLIQSFEPAEEWYYCYLDDVMFERQGAAPSPSHP